MTRILAMLYSLICYAIGVATLVYLILFIADLYVPFSINTASPLSPDIPPLLAVFWNIALIALWGAQHTFMASPGFKAWWTRIIPAPVERSTYLIFVAIVSAILVAFWVPMPSVLYTTTGTLSAVLLTLYFTGWLITLISTFLINHFHLFGLQQSYNLIVKTESKTATFRTPLFYKLVRHPMMTGIIVSLWSVPEMTSGRLIFNLAMTTYILVGIHFEEKTLIKDLGSEYEAYRQTTPSLIPGLKTGSPQSANPA